jgi:hypothetical protein
MSSLRSGVLPQPDFAFGVGGIEFFSPDDVADEQKGYGGPDWNPTWLVIARESACGDPIFIDRSSRLLPVYTAAIGMGEWEPVVVADSWDKFVMALNLIRPYAVGREHPVGLKENPLSHAEQVSIKGTLRHILGAPILEFWDLLLETTEP